MTTHGHGHLTLGAPTTKTCTRNDGRPEYETTAPLNFEDPDNKVADFFRLQAASVRAHLSGHQDAAATQLAALALDTHVYSGLRVQAADSLATLPGTSDALAETCERLAKDTTLDDYFRVEAAV
jgi:hypothetical protein